MLFAFFSLSYIVDVNQGPAFDGSVVCRLGILQCAGYVLYNRTWRLKIV